MSVSEVCHEGGSVSITAIPADIATGGDSLALQTVGKGLETHHQILNDGPIVLSKAWKHARRADLPNAKGSLQNCEAQGVSISVHQPAAGPMKRTVIQNTTNKAMPIQAPRVVMSTNCLVWFWVSGSQGTTRGESSVCFVGF